MTPAASYKQSGFLVIKNLVDPDTVKRLYDYTLQNLTRGNLDDGQVPGSPAFYQDKEVVSLQKKLLPILEAAIQTPLVPVFCYNRIYRSGAVLRMHKDSVRAEISTTISLGQQGEIWDLWLVDYHEHPHCISLSPGDALIYHGQRLYHWRSQLVHADFVSQIMFHCVDAKGKYLSAARLEIIRKIRKRCRELMGIAY